LEESLSLKIVQGVWDKFIKTSELMIVPTLGDDQKDRKPWDERRLNFFNRYIESSIVFFSPGEGEGLSKAQLDVKSFIQLQLVLKNYQINKIDLLVLYNGVACMLPVSFDGIPNLINFDSESSSHTNLDWVLKLLKMRGNEQFVNQQLKDRCEGKWVC
jgi:hypothetical protein